MMETLGWIPGTALGSKRRTRAFTVASEQIGNEASAESRNWDRAVDTGFSDVRQDVGRGAAKNQTHGAVPGNAEIPTPSRQTKATTNQALVERG